jgi:hypothetical protein
MTLDRAIEHVPALRRAADALGATFGARAQQQAIPA